jgi:hypothetical protein
MNKMTVNLAINLGTHSLLLADSLAVSVDSDGVRERAIEDFNKVQLVKAGIASVAGIVDHSPVYILNHINPTTINSEIIESELESHIQKLLNANQIRRAMLEMKSTCMIAIPGVDGKQTKLFNIKPPGYLKCKNWQAFEVGVGSVAWSFPYDATPEMAKSFRAQADAIVSKFVSCGITRTQPGNYREITPLVMELSTLLGAMADQSEVMNTRINCSIISSKGHRYSYVVDPSTDTKPTLSTHTQVEDEYLYGLF